MADIFPKVEPGGTYPVISIRQPCAAMICGLDPSRTNPLKNVENRTWALPSRFVGKVVLIHAGLKQMPEYWEFGRVMAKIEGEDSLKRFDALYSRRQDLRLGGIVGAAIFNASKQDSGSAWAEEGDDIHHWPILAARPLPFMPCRGRLGIWAVEYFPEAA
jgi:hypothetical protein